MKRILIAAAVFAACAGIASADNLAGYYGNTVVITPPDGKAMKSKVAADKTWSRVNPDGSTTKGTWTWQDDKIACFTQTEPAPAPEQKPACFPIDPHKVGDKWSTKDDKGNETKYELVAG